MSTELFSSNASHSGEPLAYRMSPRTLDEYVGQDHIVGPGRLLRRVIQADRLSSLIFYGPPGTGKTSLARVIARTTSSAFTTLNAVLTGVKELRIAIKEAQERRSLYDTRTILFIDEVHRWNKAQQDALLPWVENGTVVLIGATTQNPYFEVNSALVSRSRVFQLLPLDNNDLSSIARQVLQDTERGYGKYSISFEPGALEHLIHVSAGDARSLLNALELAVETTPDSFPPAEGAEIHVSMDVAEQSIQRKVVLYDKEGDYHFDTISAFIKSLRGSDPDAALYWLARMVYAGEDPRFIFRRMLISASEDIGMADPHALSVVESAASAFDRIGLPEGRYHLAHAAVYLATAPKSNSLMGFFDALSAVEKEQKADIPAHLKDANRDAEGFGHGAGYLYPHAYRDHWVEQQYLPSSLQGKLFYQPSQQGHEASIAEDVSRRREAQLAASLFDSSEEILTFSRLNQARDRWIQRILDNRSASIEIIRKKIFGQVKCARHHRFCVLGAEEGTLIWEALRRVPEGGVTGIISPTRTETVELLEHYAAQLDPSERPELWKGSPEEYLREHPERAGTFEYVIGRNYTIRSSGKKVLLEQAFSMLRENGRLVLAESVPGQSQRLTEAVRQQLQQGPDEAAIINPRSAELLGVLEEAETRLYTDTAHPLISWDVQNLLEAAKEAGFHDAAGELLTLTEERYVRAQDIDRWLSPGRTTPAIGDYLNELAPSGTIEELKSWLRETVGNMPVKWHSAVCILVADRH